MTPSTDTLPRLNSLSSPKEVALKAVAEAETALALAMRAIADAIGSGSVKPCTCYYMRAASAQADLEAMREEMAGGRKGDRSKEASRSIGEMLAEAMIKG